VLLNQILERTQCSTGTCSSSDDDLLILAIGHITRRKHTTDSRPSPTIYLDLTTLVGIHQIKDEIRVGIKPDFDKHALHIQFFQVSRCNILYRKPVDMLCSMYFNRVVGVLPPAPQFVLYPAGSDLRSTHPGR